MNNYTGHTPRPWKWDRDYDSSVLTGLYDKELYPVIEVDEYFLHVRNDADLALIAAAPELLAELDRLREAIETHRRNVWGAGPVEHDEDRELYAVLEVNDD